MSNVLVTANSLVPSAFISFPGLCYLQSHFQTITTFSLIPRPLLPSVSFPDHYYLQSHSQTTTTFSLIPRPLLPSFSFPILHSHFQVYSQASSLIPRPLLPPYYMYFPRPYPLTRRNSLVNQVKFLKKGKWYSLVSCPACAHLSARNSLVN